jgi:hypothetical protein
MVMVSSSPAQPQLAEPAVPAPGVVAVQLTKMGSPEAGRRLQDDPNANVTLYGDNPAQEDRPMRVAGKPSASRHSMIPEVVTHRERQIRLPSS